MLPAGLAVFLVFGGASAPGQMWHVGLQLAACAVALIAVWFLRPEAWRAGSAAWALIAAAVAVGLFQLVPLPPTLSLDGAPEALASEGRALIGSATPAFEPISLSPLRTADALLGFLPPLAALLAVFALGLRRTFDGLRWTVPALGAVGAGFGLAQVYSGGDPQLYLHEITNLGLPVGTFANVNHQACFLLMCLPIAMALVARARQNWQGLDRDFGRAIAIAALLVLIVIGLLAAGSGAGYLLLVPTLLASLTLVRRGRGERGSRLVLGMMIAGIVASALLVAFSPTLTNLGQTNLGDTDLTRRDIWATTSRMIADHWITGTGLGSFPDVYPVYERPTVINLIYVNHAHSEYLEIAAETGVAGMFLLVAAWLVWLFLGWRVWSRRIDDEYRLRRAAWISLMVPVLHSIVDYPLRTPALAVLAAVCVAIIVTPVVERVSRKAKHVSASTDLRLDL